MRSKCGMSVAHIYLEEAEQATSIPLTEKFSWLRDGRQFGWRKGTSRILGRLRWIERVTRDVSVSPSGV